MSLLQRCYAFTPDARLLISAMGPRIWDVGTGKARPELAGLKWEGWLAARSPDGRTLALQGRTKPGRGYTYLLDVATGKEIAEVELGFGVPVAFAFSPDGTILAVAVQDGGFNSVHSCIVFADMKGKVLRRFAGADVYHTCLTFSPDGKTLACGSGLFSKTGSTSLWEVATGKSIREWGGPGNLTCIAFSPNGRTLAVGGDQVIGLWDVATGKQTRELKGHKGEVFALAFSPDGSRLASGSGDTTLLIWRTDGVGGGF